ncbi:MAG: ABC transporter ATP-binding protein [Syntrophomonadaceae bacterium]|nr:ABC transporter ATP-binding protein [Syntrophomonadaceae bacterium]
MEHSVLMKLDRVSKTYDMGQVKVEALKESSLEVYTGEMLVILGPSGSGKSTLLNIMGGMDLPTGGDVIFNGQNMSKASEAVLTSYRRNEVGFVFQFYNLIPDLTARENVELAANLVKNSQTIEGTLVEVGLEGRLDHFPSQMSGGEQQRVSIARAVVKNPRLLLCDEPTGALDYQTGILILGVLKKINEQTGCTVVLITHNTAIGAMGDRVVRMRSGEIASVTENPNPLPPEGIEW